MMAAGYNNRQFRGAFFIISLALLLPSEAVGMDRVTLRPVVIHRGSPGMTLCPLDKTLDAALNDLKQDIRMSLENILPAAVILCDHCGPGQWHRAAYINMTDPQQQCPSGWTEDTTYNIRACSRSTSCSSSVFATGYQYSKVCGRVVAYQLLSASAFYGSIRHSTVEYNDVW